MKTQTLKRRGVKVRDIAAALELTTQAIYAWNGTIPPQWERKLKARRPLWFAKRL